MALVRFLLPLPKYSAHPGSKHREKERERESFIPVQAKRTSETL